MQGQTKIPLLGALSVSTGGVSGAGGSGEGDTYMLGCRPLLPWGFATQEMPLEAESGSISITLDGATATLTGIAAVVGTSSVTLAGATVAATGAVGDGGVINVTLAGATVAASANAGAAGAINVTLAGVTVAAAAEGFAGPINVTLAGATVLALARTDVIEAAISVTLDGATVDAEGQFFDVAIPFSFGGGGATTAPVGGLGIDQAKGSGGAYTR